MDNFGSPAVGGHDEACPLVIRVDNETPDRVLRLVKDIFGKNKGQTNVSGGCRIFISLQTFLAEVGFETYLHSMIDLMSGIFFHFGGKSLTQAGKTTKGEGRLPARSPVWFCCYWTRPPADTLTRVVLLLPPPPSS